MLRWREQTTDAPSQRRQIHTYDPRIRYPCRSTAPRCRELATLDLPPHHNDNIPATAEAHHAAATTTLLIIRAPYVGEQADDTAVHRPPHARAARRSSKRSLGPHRPGPDAELDAVGQPED